MVSVKCGNSSLRTGFDSLASVYSCDLHSMDHLHAYWRMENIEAPRLADGANPFTALPALGNDTEALIVHRSKLSYVMLNRYPYNPGHLLVVPFREVTDLTDLNAAERADLMDLIIF